MAPLYFQWHSSPVDWCEPNYAMSSSIVEFYNSTSNVLYFVFPALLYRLSRSYERHFGERVSLKPFWLLLVVVGAGSAYFHGTLSLAGQLIDELSIVWILALGVFHCIPFLCQRKRCSTSVDGQSSKEYALRTSLLVCTALVTMLGFRWPQINAFVLMLMGLGCAVLFRSVVRFVKFPPNVQRAYRRVLAFMSVAIALWLVERTACDYVGTVGSFLHAAWHVLILYASINCIAVGAFFLAGVNEESQSGKVVPALKYWPAEWCGVGVPYIYGAREASECDKIHYA